FAEAAPHYPDGRRGVFESNYGYALMLNGQFDDARQQLELARQIDPSDSYAAMNLGLVFDALGQTDDALQMFRQVAAKSAIPQQRREAQALAGRTLEQAGRPAKEFIRFYLEACDRSATPAQGSELLRGNVRRSDLYRDAGVVLQRSHAPGLEQYVEWFEHRGHHPTEVLSGQLVAIDNAGPVGGEQSLALLDCAGSNLHLRSTFDTTSKKVSVTFINS